MRTTSRTRWTLALTICAWLLVVPAASAYIDAGSTALIFSWIVAGIAAVGMTVKMFWYRIKRLFSRSDDDEQTPVGSGRE